MDSDKVVYWSKEDGVAIIFIDNPPMNTLSSAVVEQLNKVADEVERDREVIAVILSGRGNKAFVAGGNIKEFPGWMGIGAEYAETRSLWLQEPLNKIENLSKPTIAAINGFALGGGCELALSCDMRIAEEQVLIGLPEIKLGLFPGAGGTQRLPRLIGAGKAKEMMFTGEPIPAYEAKRIGLVNDVVPQGSALEKAKELAQRISRFSLPALSLMKKAVDEGNAATLGEGLKIEAKYFGEVFQTEDIKEGVNAFIEKRDPRFTHK
ncbi:enoyl-CoA hydratase [Ammoniphilus sp. 3BR4]|uniref:enoyl-CoA hydratase n=1 Tax=Ammoniphilus sp. 3BR4 TaxID=3158265 RepID=UPI0034662ACE